MMKHKLISILALLLVLALCACAAETENAPNPTQEESNASSPQIEVQQEPDAENEVSETIPEPETVPDAPVLDPNDLDTFFANMDSYENAEAQLDTLKQEQPELLLDYLMTRFIRGGLADCQFDDGSLGTYQFSLWYRMLGGEVISLEAATPQNYWNAWTSHGEELYELNGLDYLLADAPITGRYIQLWLDICTVSDYSGTSIYGFPVVYAIIHEERTLGDNETDAHIQLLQIFDEYDQECFALRIVQNGSSFDTDALCVSSPTLWLGDLDRDGLKEVYVSGDYASNDFMTYGWELSGSQPAVLGTEKNGFLLTGEIKDMQQETLTIEDYHHVLGTHMLRRDFSLTQGEGLTAVPGSIWEADTTVLPDDLEVVREIPAISANKEIVIPVGTEMAVTGYDGDLTVYFLTDYGISGSISLEPGEVFPDFHTLFGIEGLPIEDYFASLPYAG